MRIGVRDRGPLHHESDIIRMLKCGFFSPTRKDRVNKIAICPHVADRPFWYTGQAGGDCCYHLAISDSYDSFEIVRERSRL